MLIKLKCAGVLSFVKAGVFLYTLPSALAVRCKLTTLPVCVLQRLAAQ